MRTLQAFKHTHTLNTDNSSVLEEVDGGNSREITYYRMKKSNITENSLDKDGLTNSAIKEILRMFYATQAQTVTKTSA